MDSAVLANHYSRADDTEKAVNDCRLAAAVQPSYSGKGRSNCVSTRRLSPVSRGESGALSVLFSLPTSRGVRRAVRFKNGALAAPSQNEIRNYEAEALRLKGELLLRQNEPSSAEVRSGF